jgi:hypothetical protein
MQAPTTHPPSRTHWMLFAIAAVLGGGLLRVLAAQGDLWLDEIWSLRGALTLANPLHAALRPHDNNHLLNTVWLASLGDGRAELLYRLPSVLAGIAAVAIAGAIAARAHPIAGAVTVLLFASSQLLVTHSSEARGYGPMLAFVLLALLVLERDLAGVRPRWHAPLFWAAVMLAALAHASAILGHGVLVVYWLVRRLRDGARRELVADGLRLHLVPALGLALLYALFVSRMKIGGGYDMTSVQAVRLTSALTLGLGEGASGGVLPLLLVALVALLGLHELLRAGDARWALFAAGMLLPVLAMAASGIAHASPRYVLLGVAFFLLLAGVTTGRWIARGGLLRAAGLTTVACLVLLNLLGAVDLIRRGRGNPRAAIALMLARPGAGRVTVTSDHDFRNALIVEHYARLHPRGARLAYFPASRLPAEGAQWLILHRAPGSTDVPPDHVVLRGHAYDKRLSTTCAITTGMSWYVFERAPAVASRGAVPARMHPLPE